MLKIVILVASDMEWSFLKSQLEAIEVHPYAFGEFFSESIHSTSTTNVIFARIGWGKVSSAAGTQFIIDNWKPDCLICIGTAGGLEGRSVSGDIILATNTIIYDLHIEIGDPLQELLFYKTNIDYSWLGVNLPKGAEKGGILTADSDLRSSDVGDLVHRFDAVAADWESGAIAFVANSNNTPCIILKYVSDVVSSIGGDVYGSNQHLFKHRVERAMMALTALLPDWLSLIISRLAVR